MQKAIATKTDLQAWTFQALVFFAPALQDSREPEYELRRVADCHKNVTLIPANRGKS